MIPTQLPRLSKRRALFAGAAVLLVPALVALSVACGGDKKDDSKAAVAPTRSALGADVGLPTAVPSATAVAAPPTPVPPPPAPAPLVRTDCNAIRGTDYQSPEERDWFIQNCGPGGTALATSSGGTGGTSGAAIGNQTPTGDRLVISKAGMNADVYKTAVPASGAMPDPWGYFNALAYDFSRLPGFGGDVNSGNLIMAGHVDCAHCRNGGPGTAAFYNIRSLGVGDSAQYITADGRTVNYVVTSSYTLSPSANWDSVAASGTADMTLITCTGSFSGGEYNLRHVVAFRKA